MSRALATDMKSDASRTTKSTISPVVSLLYAASSTSSAGAISHKLKRDRRAHGKGGETVETSVEVRLSRLEFSVWLLKS